MLEAGRKSVWSIVEQSGRKPPQMTANTAASEAARFLAASRL
jgi:hypothetical protein